MSVDLVKDNMQLKSNLFTLLKIKNICHRLFALMAFQTCKEDIVKNAGNQTVIFDFHWIKRKQIC